MCEIFGITADRKIDASGLLKEFFSHSREHREGWGLAFFDDGFPQIEKEPVTAMNSSYLKSRLEGDISAAHMTAHIRRATCGIQEYDNTHPFVRQDASGRIWTLVHNGHIFQGPSLRRYIGKQKGSTDSERILCYIADEAGSAEDRFHLVEDITLELAPQNKLNFILYDGEYMYVHTNEHGGIHVKKEPGARIFSTQPLSPSGWEPLPENRLHVYKDGEEVYTGQKHYFTFVYVPEDEQKVYMDYSLL